MRFRWLPNGISIFRIFLILPILFLINTRQYKIALVFFIVAVLSDIVDGYMGPLAGILTGLNWAKKKNLDGL